MGNSKIIFGSQVLMDLSGDTVSADKVAKGLTFHDKAGDQLTGTSTLDSDTSDATASISELLDGKTAYIRGAKVTGNMPNNGGINGEITTKEGSFGIAQGYHDGSGKVGIAEAEKAKLIPANIKQGITLLGVQGEMSGTEGTKPQAKTVTPKTTSQEILPDPGYNFLSSVTVQGIPYQEAPNSAGGMTVIIGNPE